MANHPQLPPGFQLDPIQQPQGLPPGFQLDEPEDVPLGEQILGGLQTAGTIASGIIAEPIAGLAGIGAQIGEAVGLAAPGAATRTIEATREALTFQGGEESQRQLQAIGGGIETVSDAITEIPAGLIGLSALATGQGLDAATQQIRDVKQKGISEFLGEAAFEGTGSPAIAAAFKASPAAALEALGLKGLRSSTLIKAKKLPLNAKKAVAEAAPSINQLKQKASQLYAELDQSNVRVKPETFDRFVESLEKTVNKQGINKTLHPDSVSVMRDLNAAKGTAKSFSELNTLRQIAADAASSIVPRDARIGNIILNKLDNGIDALADAAGKQSKGARQLWRRAKVSESIAGMVENAGLAASGLENGLRIEARKILRSAKKKRGFSKKELKVIDELEKGSGAANAAKFLGKFGISEGKATSMLGAAIGGTIGQQLGGKAGAVSALALGQIAKKTAQRLTFGKAKFADQLVRAGGNGRAIAQAYLRNTPKAQRSISELTELLLDPRVTPDSISKISLKTKLIDDAKFFASEIKRRVTQAASVGAIIAPTLNQQQQQ